MTAPHRHARFHTHTPFAMLRSSVSSRAAAPARALRPAPLRAISTANARHSLRIVSPLRAAASTRPASLAVTPRRGLQAQAQQQKPQVKDAKIGEVRPKSNHQANAEDRRRMHCTHDEARRRISLRCDPQHPIVAVVDYEIVRPGVWDLKFTQVAPEFQHHSVADEVVARTLAFAEANKCVRSSMADDLE